MRKLFLSPAKILCGLFVLTFSVSISHALDLALTHDPKTGYSLSWEAIDPSTTDAKVTYYVYRQFGNCEFSNPGDPFNLTIGTNAVATTQQTSVSLGFNPGSRCFVVRSSDSVTGEGFTSDVQCHNFIHHLTDESILRADGDGTQRGVDQSWTFTYSLDVDAYVTAQIYPPGTQFALDSNCFVTSASSGPVKTLAQNVSRSGELGTHSITMQESWDSRSSSGSILSNGIYYLLLSGQLDSGYFPTGSVPTVSRWDSTLETYGRGTRVFTIPVDILRIMNLAATAITLTNTRSSISYFLTGDSNVRVVIAKPGSGFIVDSNGDIQAANATTLVQDDTLIVSTFTFQRKSGTNTESWDGTSSTGTVMPSGVYLVGLSASDDFGNHAIDATGNDFPNFANITLERTAGSTTGGTTSDTTPPTIAALTADGVAFASGQLFTGAVTTITVRLADTGTAGIGFGLSNLTVVGPNSQAVAGTLSNNGVDTLTFVFATPQNTNGVYTVNVTAADGSSNSTSYTVTFVISIQLSQSAFENALKVYPNPAKNTASATIQYSVSESATVAIDIFNILGEKVYSASYVEPTAATSSRSWALTNNDGEKVGSGLYLVRIKANGSSSSVEVVKKMVVVR